MTERDSTYAAVDKAFQGHIGRLYDTLTQATEADIKSGIAIERFNKGYKRALEIREAVLKAVA